MNNHVSHPFHCSQTRVVREIISNSVTGNNIPFALPINEGGNCSEVIVILLLVPFACVLLSDHVMERVNHVRIDSKQHDVQSFKRTAPKNATFLVSKW